MPLKCGVPQGSVLGPVIIALYTAPIQRIIRKHEVKHHKYAEDIQLYVKYDPVVPGEREEARSLHQKDSHLDVNTNA